jgi:hypothetical protein
MMHPQLVNERRALLEEYNISPEDCRSTLDAFHQVELAPISNRVLEYLTTSTRVQTFLESERKCIENILGKSRFNARIVVVGFGAGKSHVKTYLLGWLQRAHAKDALVVSFRIPGEHSGFNLFEDVLLFRYDDSLQYRQVYKEAYNSTFG